MFKEMALESFDIPCESKIHVKWTMKRKFRVDSIVIAQAHPFAICAFETEAFSLNLASILPRVHPGLDGHSRIVDGLKFWPAWSVCLPILHHGPLTLREGGFVSFHVLNVGRARAPFRVRFLCQV